MKKDLVAASAEPLVLSLLLHGENYGHAIIQTLRERSAEEIKWTDGMLYPVLHRMEEKGLISSRWSDGESTRKRRYYAITRSGRNALAEQRQQWLTVNSTLHGLWRGQYA